MSKLKTYSNRLGSGKLLNNLDSEDLADGYSKCDITEPEPTPASTKMKNIQDGENVPINTTLDPESPVNPSSAGKSRYGRAHKPKIAEDFLPTDKKVGAILGLSPKGKSSQSNGILNLTNSKETKGRRLFDNSHENDKIDQQVATKSRKRVSLIEPVSKERINPQNTSTPKTNASFTSNNSTNVEECSVPNTEITSHISVLTLDTKMSDCNWIVGDLAWARVGRHPYWPCMIANDPELQIFMKTRILARSTSLILRFLHVQFFGDNGRHSWVSASSVFKFEGKASFFEEAKKILAQIKSKKGKKFHTAFSARESSKNKWESAVSEAEIFLLKQREERIKYFIDNFPLKLEDSDAETDEVGKSENEEVEKPQHSYKKRKRLDDDSDGKPSKQIKLEPVEQATPKRSPNKKTATPRSSTQNKKKTPVKKKPYSKRLGKDFELFTEKNLKKVSEEHPTWTKQEVEKFLVDTWADMDRNERAKYQVRLSSTPQISVSSSSEDDDDEEDDQSNDRDSSPARNVSTVSLIKKGGSLFRGTVREKVCQICLKPGNTVKCKGPCLGVFHVDCIRNDMVKKEVVVIGIKKGAQKSIGASKNISVSDANDGNTDVVKIKTEVLLEEEIITPEDEVTGITESDETETNKNEDVAAVLDTAENSFNTVETEEAQNHAIPEENSVQLPTAIEKTIEHCAKEEENKAKDDTNVEFRCKDCSEGRNPPCFVCGLENEPKLQSETRLRCVIS